MPVEVPVRPRVWQLGVFGAVAAVSGLAAIVAARSYLQETSEFFPDRQAGVPPVESAGIAGMATVAFSDSSGAILRGWYAPSSNRAAVVLLHGAGGDRASLLPEARQLASRGFGVLAFDWPGQGESDGSIHWNAGEARALVAAIDFLARQPELEAGRLGALGFSMGGAVLARVAPDEPRLQALVFAGTPSDQLKQIDFENRRWGPLTQLPALWAVQRGGVPIFDQRPVDRIGLIAPRPVLIVTGTADPTVPEFLAHELFEAAREPRQLLVVDGAAHGRFEQAPGSTYLDRLVGFFEGALLA